MTVPVSGYSYSLGHHQSLQAQEQMAKRKIKPITPAVTGTPTLVTARFTLEPHRASLVTDEQVRWLNDPENVKYSEQRHHKHTLESQHSYLNGYPQGSHIWLIRREGRFDLGTITAYIDAPNKIANMGILIGKEHWGQGVGIECWSTVMAFLEGVGMKKIEAGCMASNLSMTKLALKSGMKDDGVRYDHFLTDHGRVASRHFAKWP